MSRYALACCLLALLASPMAPAEEREVLVPEGEPETILQAGGWSDPETSTALAFSPDGRTLATGGDRVVRLWDVSSGRELRRLEGHSDFVKALAFSPDGRTLASGGDDKAVRLWEVATGRTLRSLDIDPSPEESHSVGRIPDVLLLGTGGVGSGYRNRLVRALAFSPDGRTLASGDSEGAVHLWEVDTGRRRHIVQGHTGPVRALAFSPDGQTLASGGADQLVRLWETGTGVARPTLSGQNGPVQALAFSPDGRLLASGASNGSLRWWELEGGRELRPPKEHAGPVQSVLFLPGGRILASAGADGAVQLWEVGGGRGELQTVAIHDSSVETVAFSPDGRTLAWSMRDHSVRLWEVASGREVRRLESTSSPVWSVAFSPDGSLLASGGGDGTVRLWELATGHEKQRIGYLPPSIQAVAFSPDGRSLAAGGEDGSVQLWEVPSGRALRSPLDAPGSSKSSPSRASDAPVGPVHAVAFSPDGRLLAAGGAEGLVLMGTDSGRKPLPLRGHLRGVQAVAFSPNGRTLVSGGGDGTVRVWSVEESAPGPRRLLKGHEGPVQAVAFSPDGRLLASAGYDKTVRLWEWESGRERRLLKGHDSPVQAVAFSPDGRTLASGAGDGTVRLWTVATGRTASLLEARSTWVSSLAFSPDGNTLAAGSANGATWLWSLPLSDTAPSGLLRGGKLGWLSHLRGRPAFRHDGGRFLYQVREGGALEPVAPPHTEPRLSASAHLRVAPGDFGEEGVLVLSVSNASDAGRAYWVRVEPVELPPGLVLLNANKLMRLEPGRSEDLIVGLSYLKPEDGPVPESSPLRLQVLHAAGEGPMLEVPLPLHASQLVRGQPQVENKTLTFTLKNTGTQATGPLSVEGAFRAATAERVSAPVQKIDLTPGQEARLSMPIPDAFLERGRFSFDVAATYERWPRTWVSSEPEVRVPVPYALYVALGLGALLLFAGVHYVRVYRNPLVMQAASAPVLLKAWPLADMPKADEALRRAKRRDSTITAAGIPLPRWERMLRSTRTPREAASAFAEALGGQLGAPLGARAWALSLPPLRLRFARDTAVAVLDGTRLESGEAERVMADIFQDGRGPSQVLVLDRTHAQNASQLLCGMPRVRSVVLPADRLRDLLLVEEPARLLEHTIAEQVAVSELSPYQVAGGVKLEHLFFGREREVRAIVDRSLRNFLVVGQRQMGKSSLLLAVLRRLQARGDVDATYVELSDADLHRRLARERGAVPPGAALPPFVEVAAGTPARPRVWLIDEADDFIRTDARADYPVVKAMRALAEEGRAYFILAGFWDLYRAVVLDEQQPLRNFGEHLRLEPLDARSALALVTEPMAALGLRWDAPTTPELLLAQAGRRANLLVLSCKALVETLPPDTHVLTREHLERVLREDKDLRDQGRRWRGDHPLHRAVVRQALLLGRPTRQEVRQALKARGVDVRATDFDEAMDHRELSYVLVPDGEGRLYCPVPLMQRYIESERDLEVGLGEDLDDLRRGFSEVPPPA